MRGRFPATVARCARRSPGGPAVDCTPAREGRCQALGAHRAGALSLVERPARGVVPVSWLKKLMPARIRTEAPAGRKRSVPEGLWEKCDRCGAVLYRPELEENLEVCPKCSHHMPIRARVRLKAFLDQDGTSEIGAALGPVDVLNFKDQKKYSDRIKAAQKSTGERDALVAMQGLLHGQPLVACAFDFAFMGGSMGSVVGERFAEAAERALEIRSPLVCFSATGGARMQEL